MELDLSSPFISYNLTEQELRQGLAFNPAQKAVIQNFRAEYASDLLKTRLDGQLRSEEESNKLAYTTGAYEALTALLNMCAQEEEKMQQEALDKLNPPEPSL